MGKDLDAVLVPGDPGPGNSPGHADEHDLVTQEELVVKVGGLLNLGAVWVVVVLLPLGVRVEDVTGRSRRAHAPSAPLAPTAFGALGLAWQQGYQQG